MYKSKYTGQEIDERLDKVGDIPTEGVVTTEGDQTISGIKDFVDNILLKGSTVFDGVGEEIGVSGNLNDITTPGVYRANRYGGTISNTPYQPGGIPPSFTLLVFQPNQCIQILIPVYLTTQDLWIRTQGGNDGWYDWVRLGEGGVSGDYVTLDTTQSINGNKDFRGELKYNGHNVFNGFGKEIPLGADLNEYTTTGVYVSRLGSVLNAPSDTPQFALMIFEVGPILQFYIGRSSDMYFRTQGGVDGWSEWQIAGGSERSKYVTIDTSQGITGQKIFNSRQTFTLGALFGNKIETYGAAGISLVNDGTIVVQSDIPTIEFLYGFGTKTPTSSISEIASGELNVSATKLYYNNKEVATLDDISNNSNFYTKVESDDIFIKKSGGIFNNGSQVQFGSGLAIFDDTIGNHARIFSTSKDIKIQTYDNNKLLYNDVEVATVDQIGSGVGNSIINGDNGDKFVEIRTNDGIELSSKKKTSIQLSEEEVVIESLAEDENGNPLGNVDIRFTRTASLYDTRGLVGLFMEYNNKEEPNLIKLQSDGSLYLNGDASDNNTPKDEQGVHINTGAGKLWYNEKEVATIDQIGNGGELPSNAVINGENPDPVTIKMQGDDLFHVIGNYFMFSSNGDLGNPAGSFGISMEKSINIGNGDSVLSMTDLDNDDYTRTTLSGVRLDINSTKDTSINCSGILTISSPNGFKLTADSATLNGKQIATVDTLRTQLPNYVIDIDSLINSNISQDLYDNIEMSYENSSIIHLQKLNGNNINKIICSSILKADEGYILNCFTDVSMGVKIKINKDLTCSVDYFFTGSTLEG